MIKMFLSPGTVDHPLYEHQGEVQVALVLIAIFSVPVMLFVKPILKHKQREKAHAAHAASHALLLDPNHTAHSDAAHDDAHHNITNGIIHTKDISLHEHEEKQEYNTHAALLEEVDARKSNVKVTLNLPHRAASGDSRHSKAVSEPTLADPTDDHDPAMVTIHHSPPTIPINTSTSSRLNVNGTNGLPSA